MILDAAVTVLSYFGFNRTVYGNPRNNRKKKMKWYEELHEERTKDIRDEDDGKTITICDDKYYAYQAAIK